LNIKNLDVLPHRISGDETNKQTDDEAPSGDEQLLPSPRLDKLNFAHRTAMEWWNTAPRSSASLHRNPLEPAEPNIRQEAEDW